MSTYFATSVGENFLNNTLRFACVISIKKTCHAGTNPSSYKKLDRTKNFKFPSPTKHTQTKLLLLIKQRNMRPLRR